MKIMKLASILIITENIITKYYIKFACDRSAITGQYSQYGLHRGMS